MYTVTDYPTKKALKEAIARGDEVRIYQPGGFFDPPEASPTYTGTAYLEGPHYPKPHRWYATATVEQGRVTSVT